MVEVGSEQSPPEMALSNLGPPLGVRVTAGNRPSAP